MLIKKLFGSFGIKLINTLLTFSVAVLMARLLGASNYGEYAFFISLIGIVSAFVKFGLPQLLVRETAISLARKDFHTLWFLWKWSAKVMLSLSIVGGFGIISCYYLLYDGSEQKIILLALLLVFFLGLIASLFSAIIQGLGAVIWAQVPEKIVKPSFVFIMILLGYWFFGYLSLEASLIVTSVGFFFASIACLFIAERLKNELSLIAPGNISGERRRGLKRTWVKSTIPLGGLAIFQIINGNLDVLILSYFSGYRDVGIYKVAVQASLLIIFSLRSVNMVVMPMIAQAFEKDDQDSLQGIVNKSSVFIFSFSALVYLSLVIFGELIIAAVFGNEYIEAYSLILIIATGYVFVSAMGPVEIVLNMTGHERATFKIMMLASFLNVCANFIMIPLFGYYGAAIASVVTLMFWSLLMRIIIKQTLDIETLFISPLLNKSRGKRDR